MIQTDISLHGISRWEVLIFYRCGFFFCLLFSTPNLRGHWTDLNETWTIFTSLMTATWKIWSELPRAFTPHGLGQKTAFGDRLWTLTEHISTTEHDVNNRIETFQSTRTSVHAFQIWLTLIQKRLRTVGEFLPPPLNFRIGRHWQPYHMDVI